jgi:hypothetical protein
VLDLALRAHSAAAEAGGAGEADAAAEARAARGGVVAPRGESAPRAPLIRCRLNAPQTVGEVLRIERPPPGNPVSTAVGAAMLVP